MTATVTDCENERLREQIENMEEVLHRYKEEMTTLLQELTSIETLEMQIERRLNSLTKKREHFKETLIRTSHFFDELMRRV